MSFVFIPITPAPRAVTRSLLGAIVLGLIVCSLPARSQIVSGTVPPVEWFVDNPRERNTILELCRQYPGPARRDDHCAAAWEANIAAAEREARARVGAEASRNRGDTSRPTEPQYWRLRPEERREYLSYCNRMSPADQARAWCGPAREADSEGQAPSARRVPPTLRRS